MRFSLKGYQDTAAREVLKSLSRARREHREYGDLTAFPLSATTGAGKTVIASAVIEALFYGSAEFDVEPDPRAAILWVTDDPPLNEQTRYRLQASSDLLGSGQLVIIDEGFDAGSFEAGRVYFLNVQKLSKSSTFSKPKEGVREHSLWTTLKNTINDSSVDLYMVLDEAHRGMKETREKSSEKRNTIVQRIINGHDDIPPVPVVWGISATVERFNKAMTAADGRTLRPGWSVPPSEVQDSGLLKDVIILEAPDEDGEFSTTMLRSATEAFVEADELWGAYGSEQRLADPVKPLMVIQVPDKVSDTQLAEYIDVIRDVWEEFTAEALAHVLGEHTTREAGKYAIPYIKPQDVQDASHVRVLFAKEAVTTGWDCPRAEILFSMRAASDKTHITQLMGRMVRTPLGHRVLSDERLNQVTCFLPRFDATTVRDVADRLTGVAEDSTEDDRENAVSSRKVVTSGVGLQLNPDVPDEVVEFIEQLPSLPKPKPDAKPIRRLMSFAAHLAVDELEPEPKKYALKRLGGVLDGKLSSHSDAVDEIVEEIHTAEIHRLVASREGTRDETVHRTSDQKVVDERFRSATRALTPALANEYARSLALKESDGEDLDFYDAKARTSAVVGLPGLMEAVEAEAEHLCEEWLAEHKVAIRSLTDSRRAAYDEITAQARVPVHRDTEIPTNITVDSKDRDGNALETARLHVLSTAEGHFPIGSLKSWEQDVVRKESARVQTVGWYRNPSNATAHALQVPYKKDGQWSVLLPDFVFVTRNADGELDASIVDPHGHHLSDALPKLRGLAKYAEQYGDRFIRIEAVAENSKKELVTIDLLSPAARELVMSADSAVALYDSAVARAYK